MLRQADNENSDQIGWMPRLICLRWGTDRFVGFVMPWLNFHIETTSDNSAYGIVTNLHMRPFCNTWTIRNPRKIDNAFSSLVCAITVHLLLFLFECHGNKEYVRALACVRVI